MSLEELITSKDKYPSEGYCVNYPIVLTTQFRLEHIQSRDAFTPIICEQKYVTICHSDDFYLHWTKQ